MKQTVTITVNESDLDPTIKEKIQTYRNQCISVIVKWDGFCADNGYTQPFYIKK